MDPDEARIEHALKLNLFSMMSISAISTLLSLIGYNFSIILLDTVFIMFFLSLFFAVVWLLEKEKNWKWMRIIPVGIIFLVAVYGNFVGGIGAPAMLIYILAILLASQLYGKRMQFAMILASILSFTAIALLHYKSLIPTPRVETAAFQNRVFIAISLMFIIGILLRFIISQLEEAVHISRDNEQQLAATNEELLAANEEFEAQNEELVKLNWDLEKSEENFRTLFESSPIPVVLHRDGKIILANDAFFQLTGTSKDKDFSGISILDYVATEDKPRIIGYLQDRQQGGNAPKNYEASIIRNDGIRLQCEIKVNPVMIDDVQATLVFANDITKRKKAENTLREQEGTLRSILEATPVGIALLVDRRFTKVNASFCKMTGYTEEEVLGQLTRIIYMDDETYEQKGKDIYEDMIKNGTGTIEMPMRRKNGELFYTILSLAPSDPNDLSAGVCATALDITDRKTADMEKEHMQKQLSQAQKMEAVGTLTGGIAHDFNNMLTGIMGSLSMMETLVNRNKQPEIDSLKKYIETAQESSRRAADITKQLLTFSRKSELKLTPVDINLSLKHIQKICQNSFPKSVNLVFSVRNAPLFIHADPGEIEQVLLNLCLNASHAMTFMRPEGERPGGTLTVSAEEIQCDDNFCALHRDVIPGDNYAMIRVNDTGVGIDEETRCQIFDPFFTTKNKQDGTGLGLAMVYSIIKQHGGLIDVYSEEGKGSAFNVYLPALDEEMSIQRKDTVMSGITAGTGTILVIDDEKAILGVARGMLEQCGYQVMTAKNGAEGIEVYRCEHQNIDAVLLDLSMPGMSGMEVFEELKNLNPGVKVLISSGLMDEEETKNAFKIGIRGFLQKPYSVVDLSAKTKEVLES